MVRPQMARALVLIVGLLVASPAYAEGISARFGNDAAVQGRDVTIRVEVSDPIRAVDSIEVELRPVGADTWLTAAAVPADTPDLTVRWWLATFTSTAVWRSPPPAALEARARLYGARGGVVLALGDIEPLPIDVFTPSEAERRARVLAAPSADEALSFAGYLGVEGRAGNSARARAYLGFGGPVAPRGEVIAFVSLGPAFSRPDATAGGGPIVLGAELASRFYTRSLSAAAWTLFAGPYATADVRFPGIDVGGGLRAGVTWVVRSELAVELAISGAAMGFGVSAADDDDPGLGFVGGLRLGIRLGTVGDG